jgi:hypothetical protein
MKNRLRAIIALLKSRAYLDSQYEATERKPMLRNDSHSECKPRQKHQTEQDDTPKRSNRYKGPRELAA